MRRSRNFGNSLRKNNPMKTAPSYIVEEVRRIDPNLRIRWSRQRKKFVVEIKTLRCYLPLPVKYKKDAYGKIIETRCDVFSDRYIQYHDGFVSTGVECDVVSSSLPLFLRQADTQRIGRENFIKALEERERQEEIINLQRESDLLKDIAGESYNHLSYRQGERLALNGI